MPSEARSQRTAAATISWAARSERARLADTWDPRVRHFYSKVPESLG